MSAPLRLTLALAVFLFAGGVVVAPHVDPPNRPQLHVDHVPTALRLAILTHFGHLFTSDGPAFVGERPLPVLAAGVLALLALRYPRPRHPDRLGVFRAPISVPDPQGRPNVAHGPPRISLAS